MVPGNDIRIESERVRRRGTYNQVVNSTVLNRAVIVLAIVGLFVAGILSYSSAVHVEVPCRADAVTNCAAVTNSDAGKLAGIPVSYLGFLAYAALLGLAVFRGRSTGNTWQKLTQAGFWLSGIGLAFSIYLQTVSIGQLGQLCAWCLASAVTMLGLFILHGMISQRGEQPIPEEKDAVKESFFRRKNDMTVLAVMAVFGLLAFGFTAAGMTNEAKGPINVELQGLSAKELMVDPVKIHGNPDAKVSIIEVADILCPACRKSYPELQKIMKQYEGKINSYYIHFPLYNVPGHELAIPAAMIGEYAAEQGKFWNYMDLVFAERNDERVKTESGLMGIASEAGLDTVELKKRMDVDVDSRLLDSVNRDFNLAVSTLKITGTPTFILSVNGGPLEAYSFEGLKEALKRPDVQQYLK